MISAWTAAPQWVTTKPMTQESACSVILNVIYALEMYVSLTFSTATFIYNYFRDRAIVRSARMSKCCTMPAVLNVCPNVQSLTIETNRSVSHAIPLASRTGMLLIAYYFCETYQIQMHRTEKHSWPRRLQYMPIR